MSMKYIRDYYKVPAKRGARVKWFDNRVGQFLFGTITSATNYVKVRFDGECHKTYTARIHPKDLVYLDS